MIGLADDGYEPTREAAMAAFKKSWRGDDAVADSAVPQHARYGPLHHQLRPLWRRERSIVPEPDKSEMCALVDMQAQVRPMQD